MSETSTLANTDGHQDEVHPRRRIFGERWRIIFLGVVALAVVTIIFVVQSGPASSFRKDDALTYTVQRGDLTISFNERGSLEAGKSTQIFCRVEGTSTIVSVAPEGARVKKGELLVELDSSELDQQLNNQEIQVQSAQAERVQAVGELEIQKSQNQSDVEMAEVELDLAALDLKKYQEKEYPLSIAKAEAEIFLASEELERSRNTYEWALRLAKKGYVSKTKLTADEIAMKRFSVQKEQAEGGLELLREYTHTKELRQYESLLSQARAALGRTKSKNRAYLAKAEADLRAKQSTYDLSVKRLNKLNEQLKKTKIHAPQDGMVVYHQGRRRSQERIIEQGATVRQNQHLIDLPDVSTMAVTVQVHESQIDRVALGTPTLVNVDALPHLNLRGKVTKIGVLPDSVNRWLNPDLKVYRTEITLEDSDGVELVKPGMSANVTLVVARLRDVMYVPVQSVTTIDGRHHCLIRQNGDFVPREVTVGLFSKSHIEIQEGLAQEDVIKLMAPTPEGSREPEEEISDDEIPELATGDPSPTAERPRRGGRDESRARRGGDAGRRAGNSATAPRGRGPKANAGTKTSVSERVQAKERSETSG